MKKKLPATPKRCSRKDVPPPTADAPLDALHGELRGMIHAARQRVAGMVNAELTRLYWVIGKRLRDEALAGMRAAYGAKVVEQVAERLTREFGRGFEAKNLHRMLQFAQAFPDAEIVATLSRQLSWSHVVAILPHRSGEGRMFYATTACAEGWSVRELRERIGTKTFERTRLAQVGAAPPVRTGGAAHPTAVAPLPPEWAFKDPYFLDFLGLPPGHDERHLEEAILRELERFILELGRGFAFVERQKRMIIDGEDHHLDLLFYHRRMRRLVAVELKIGKFKAADKGQMELYLKWLDRHERQPGEETPLGLILCAESSREQVELLEMHKDGIMVAEYWTDLPPKKEIEQRLHQALAEARERLARGMSIEGRGDAGKEATVSSPPG